LKDSLLFKDWFIDEGKIPGAKSAKTGYFQKLHSSCFLDTILVGCAACMFQRVSVDLNFGLKMINSAPIADGRLQLLKVGTVT
jgi:hypothetical protein